ncbi:MAG: hypothetical protein WKG01_09050 [Kofleriaceae bacterium]
MRALSAMCLFTLFGACGGSDDGFAIEADCNPLGFTDTASHRGSCMVPWPSSAFEIADGATATGRRLALTRRALPINADQLETDPTDWNLADGFSPAAPMVITFPGGVSVTGLPPIENLDLSLGADSATVIVDMMTGARVAHWAELDAPAEATPDRQALFLRPGARLAGGHRYAVGITKRVRSKSGGELSSPPGFVALRDGTSTSHALLEAMRPRFGDVLSALATAGVPAEQLVVAWDFTVASDAFIHSDMIAARDRAVTALASHPIAYAIESDTPEDQVVIKRKIMGTLDAPLFLTNDGEQRNGTTIARDAVGLPAVQGFYQIPFQAIIPACAYTSPTPVPMILYGHGLLGSANEATGGVQRTTASELCMVFVGTDLRGMSTVDFPAVARALNEMSLSNEVFEVIEQGFVNYITLAHAMRTSFTTNLFLDGTKQLVDPTKVYYYGISQGAIMGAGVMAYEPTITRAALAVGGANYSLLLERSLDWPTYKSILQGAYPDPLDTTLAVNLFQMRWDKVEGAGIANSLTQGTPTGVPAKQILMQVALGDEQVPNQGSWWQARTMGIPVLGPTPLMPWGLQLEASPLAQGSALVIMDGGAPPPPSTNVPPEDFKMHNLTRNQPAARRQIGEFFRTGKIVNHCEGACVCPAACD